MSQAVLLEFGTHTSDKNDVLASTAYMADVIDRALYGGVTGAASGQTEKDAAGWTGAAWAIGLFVVGVFVYAFAASGRLKTAGQKWKRTFQEMTGGLLGGRNGEDR